MPRERYTVFDFGLTRLAGGFHQDWGYVGEPEDVAREQLGESADAAALEHDVSLLVVSALSDAQIERFWGAATGENYRFEPPESGRDLLRRLWGVAREWQRTHGNARPETDPAWEAAELRERVLRAVRDAPSFSAELREVLAVCARSVSVALAFRMLLRLHVACLVALPPALWAEYREIGAALALGEHAIDTVAFLVGGTG
ncbi:hypothetical protein AB0N28_15615 [Streptomyces sp. NPDC051130]|uniref:hypothetical protein n=1 Tax=Streptomyces sp. NPDC051130 TaxID=3157223 RepID=UPI003414B742